MVTLKKIQHRDAPRIGIYFGYDDRLKQSARRIGARWSQSQRCWYLDYNKENYQKIKINTHLTKKGVDRIQSPLDRLAGLENTNDNNSKNTEK